MSVYQLKTRFPALLRPLVAKLAQCRIGANQVTIMAMVVSVIVGLWLVITANSLWFWLMPVWLFMRMALNAIDGMLAREFNQQSALGAYLNELGDLVSDVAMFMPFIWVAPFRCTGWYGCSPY